MSPGSDDDDVTKLLFAKSSMQDYQRLCDLDVLGIQQPVDGEQSVYEEFMEQLCQSEDGWYETGLFWKPEAGELPSNECGI